MIKICYESDILRFFIVFLSKIVHCEYVLWVRFGYFWSVLNKSRWIVTQIAMKTSRIFSQIGLTI